MLSGFRPTRTKKITKDLDVAAVAMLPKYVDWRTKNLVTDVKFQVQVFLRL